MEISVQMWNNVLFPVKVHMDRTEAHGSTGMRTRTHTQTRAQGPTSRLSLTSMFDLSFRIQSGLSLQGQSRTEVEEEEEVKLGARSQAATGA